MQFTIEIQREAEDFSDARMEHTTSSLSEAWKFYESLKGHRRLIAWDMRSGIATPLELERL